MNSMIKKFFTSTNIICNGFAKKYIFIILMMLKLSGFRKLNNKKFPLDVEISRVAGF